MIVRIHNCLLLLKPNARRRLVSDGLCITYFRVDGSSFNSVKPDASEVETDIEFHNQKLTECVLDKGSEIRLNTFRMWKLSTRVNVDLCLEQKVYFSHRLCQKLFISHLNLGEQRKFKHQHNQTLHYLSSPIPVSKGKQKADNAFEDHPESAMRIVRRHTPTHCTYTDIVTPVDDGHVQNADTLNVASKGTSPAMWKAFLGPGPIRYTYTGVSNNVWVNRSLRSQSAPSTPVNTKRVGESNPSSSINRRISTRYKKQRSRAHGTGTGVNMRLRNVVRRTHSNRVTANHVTPTAGNNGEGSSSTPHLDKNHCTSFYISIC
ncbi:hypothetical protein Tco_0498905 [Tanacetum coccineum]